MPAALFQIFIEESFQLLERDDVHLIVKIGVVGTGDDEQLLVVAGELAVSRLTERSRQDLCANLFAGSG